ncbi:MAG: DNA mismatch repair endonuclease MutL, partial [Clostridia bacterium]|nr:DNA mismatch repair endonuclease MutL [Clostridia bacterium]
MPIRILDAATVGRIAAGEVVERPSSVVKELVENSLDAGATAITVEMRAGGIEMLRVTDNGCGIEPGQVRLAFENHATSKLQTADQLDDIRTLGFRGEALPSIAAVSHVEMTTRARGQESGVKLNIDGGQNVRVAETGCPEGTTIVMRDLFYNIPVRRAFLKKPAYEAGLVSDAVARLMLGNPKISMRLVSNGNTVYHTFGDGKLRHAVFAVYGKETAEKMVEIDASLGATRVWGLIGVGELAKSTRAHQMFFINGRSVRCGLLTRALEQVCRSRVTIGLYPMCALNLTLPPNAIDVNVHPNKLEVRFRDEAGTQATVEKLLSSAFEGEHVLDWKRDSASAREITKTASVREVIPAEKPTQTNMFTQTPSIREIVSSGEKRPQSIEKPQMTIESAALKKPQMPPLPGMDTHIAETQKANPEAHTPLPFVSSSRTLRECDPARLKDENRLRIIENKLKSVNCELENEKNRPKSVYNVKHIIDNRAESVEN